MVKFIELHKMPLTDGEASLVLQNLDDIAYVSQSEFGTIILLRRSTGYLTEVSYRVTESYEEVKKLLLGAEPQRVPWEAD